jgi:hypothetical protein
VACYINLWKATHEEKIDAERTYHQCICENEYKPKDPSKDKVEYGDGVEEDVPPILKAYFSEETDHRLFIFHYHRAPSWRTRMRRGGGDGLSVLPGQTDFHAEACESEDCADEVRPAKHRMGFSKNKIGKFGIWAAPAFCVIEGVTLKAGRELVLDDFEGLYGDDEAGCGWRRL